jgi:prepilin-type N-terminal cleavage/methylation domain-containing protein
MAMTFNLHRRHGSRARGTGPGGFTLVEVMVAMTILLIATSLTMGAYVAALKRTLHAQKALNGETELRYAVDLLSDAVRSAPQLPVVEGSGLQLVVAPKNLGYATVLDTTWIDSLHNVKGSKSNQRMLHLSNVTPSVVVNSVFGSSARPAGSLAAGDVATYFNDASALPTTDLNDLFASGDTLTIPATSYGPETTGVINNISNNSGNKTLTLTASLGVDVPNGTRIAATAGPRMLFAVQATGDLRYYPDQRDLTHFIVIAHDIDPAPLTDPSDTTSARTTPFTISGSVVSLNLQQVPAGSMTGRTLQGVRTVIYTRTDPLAP